jgi:hypothetical protein
MLGNDSKEGWQVPLMSTLQLGVNGTGLVGISIGPIGVSLQ